ncbi:MAG: ferritin-like domain-containing protein [Candidatus Baltobacteraceae bacterium]
MPTTTHATKTTKGTTGGKPFVTDVKELRRRAAEQMEKGAVTGNYEGDSQQTIEILQAVLATEIVCVLRYTVHAITASGIDSDSVKKEFQEHASDEQEHVQMVAERIDQLGGKPNFNPDGLSSRSVTQYVEGADLVDKIKEDLIAERIVVEHYRDLIRYFGEKDPTTTHMLKLILAVEEDHASDMHDLLVAREGKPFLKD